MAFTENFDKELRAIEAAATENCEALTRLKCELSFAKELAAAFPEHRREWEGLAIKAAQAAKEALAGGAGAAAAARNAEDILAPLSQTAKEFTIHCVGHAHIDMNWMWSWQETVATVNDTFSTVDRLMNEFPGFHFSQSQASVYQIMKEYLPELYQRVKKRVAEGRWEVTASQWVEGDKNMASGESMCRHLLYTRRFFKEEFSLPFDKVKIDWECDTFGHAITLPGILTRGGVRRYYFHRGAEGPRMFWWQGKDGSRLLAFDARDEGYNGVLNEHLPRRALNFYKETGLKDFLYSYGVGDHGGGPTRRDLIFGQKMDAWPVCPRIKLSTTDAFFSAVEAKAQNLPVVDVELNCCFEGCYTSQSLAKRANRTSENALVEAELAALLGKGLARLPYPSDALKGAWQKTLFNQFHDILPGSGMHVTYEYASGLLQEILAQTTMIKTRALRAVAGQVDTAALCACEAPSAKAGPGAGIGPGIGGGPGDLPYEACMTRHGSGAACCDPFVVFNPSPWKRNEVVSVRIWDRKYPDGQISVKDDAGLVLPAQMVEKGNYWGHDFIGVAFPARDVGGLGYRSYCVAQGEAPAKESLCKSDKKGTIENEFFKVTVEQESGAISHLIDKHTGADLVPLGERLGVLEYFLEAPHGMTAWVIGQIVKTAPFLTGATLECPNNGPHLVSMRAHHKFNDSKFTLTISLAAGVPRIDFTLDADWLERGTPESGVPMLRVAFPLALRDTVANFECANGHVARAVEPDQVTSLTLGRGYTQKGVAPNPGEVPAQKWMDLSGKHEKTGAAAGATLLNDSKYGHHVARNVMRLTLLRSSYDPDPLPDLGRHQIRFALRPHVGAWSASDSTRAGYDFNLPLNAVGTGSQKGRLPALESFGEILTPNVMLSCMKKAEDSNALIVRLYEMEGRDTLARFKLGEAFCAPGTSAVETDLLERPLAKNSAKVQKGILSVKIPAFGLATVKLKA